MFFYRFWIFPDCLFQCFRIFQYFLLYNQYITNYLIFHWSIIIRNLFIYIQNFHFINAAEISIGTSKRILFWSSPLSKLVLYRLFLNCLRTTGNQIFFSNSFFLTTFVPIFSFFTYSVIFAVWLPLFFVSQFLF